MAAEALIPIDIQCNKLVDWLVDRRHCNIKWQMAAEVVKEKISDALQDMPNTEEMQKLLKGSCFHYFKCVKIVSVLKDTEKESKNIFGMYSSKRMKDWQEIVKLYEKENLHLAELSSRLLRNLNYEIPAIKRQIAKCHQIQEESRKKIQDCVRNTQEVKRHYSEECKKVEIVGKNVQRELLELVRDLPKEFDDIAAQCKDLYPVLEYYIAFVEFSLGSNSFSDEILLLLRHLSTLGNTTVYQWRTGDLPDKILKEDSLKDKNMKEEESEEIDWDISFDPDPVEDAVIDFDVSTEDLGIVLETAGCGEEQDNGFEILNKDDMQSWDIEEVSVAEVPNGSKLDSTEKVATGDDALSVLEFVKTRNQFVNELLELTGFLSQRLAETQRESDVLSINQFQEAPPILQLTSSCELESMLVQVTSIYNSLTSNRMTQLCRILDSPKFVERVADTLSRRLALTKKYENQVSVHEVSSHEATTELNLLHPKLALLVDECKEWKQLVEKEISKRYKDRPVHLMGAINLL
ncbi:CDK5 regulatory subunit-associated protein 3 [Ciona intestinalis]